MNTHDAEMVLGITGRSKVAERLDGELLYSEEPEAVLLRELLIQQISIRRHLLILATIAVIGFVCAVICWIVIAAQLFKANDASKSSSSSSNVVCTAYGCY